MFANRTALTVFPTLVWIYDLSPADRDAVEASAVRYVDALLTPRPPLEGRMNWQTPTDLQTRPEFDRLNRLVIAAAEAVLDFLALREGPLEITGAWANIGPPGASHPEHSHPNNFLSVVYYAKAPPGGNAITFHDPRPQAHVVAPPVKAKTINNASSATVAAQPGRIVAFPAWLQHSVPPNRGAEERMSIAFNVMFRDSLARPRWSGPHGVAGPREEG